MMGAAKALQLMETLGSAGEKEDRLAAAASLQKLCAEPGLESTWPRLLASLETILSSTERGSSEIRKSGVGVAASLGHRMGSPDFVGWLSRAYEGAGPVEAKAAFLAVVNAVLAKEKTRISLDPPAMTQLAYNVTAWLEAVESPKLLIPLMEACVSIAKLHVPVFSPHFRDVVDIVMGWYIEVEQGGPVRAKCEEVIGGLGLFWRAELGFTLNDMLAQFIRDAELYAKEADEDALYKAALLIRGTRLIFESMGLAGGSVEAFQERLLRPFAAESFPLLLDAVRHAAAAADDDADLLVEAAPMFKHLIEWGGAGFAEMRATWWDELIGTLAGAAALSNRTTRLCLAALKDLVDTTPTDFLLPMIEPLIGPEGILRPLRFHHSQKVGSAVLDIYRILLTPKSITTLQQIFSLVLGELSSCFERLRPSGSAEGRMGVWEKGFRVHSREEATGTIVFSAAALSSLAFAKNSLIGMWSLSPNLLGVLTSEVPFCEPWVPPPAHYALLHLLRVHAQRHEEFLASSALSQPPQREGTPFMTASKTAPYLGHILACLTGIMRAEPPPLSRRLCLNWLRELTTAADKPGLCRLFTTEPWGCLVKALIDMVWTLPTTEAKEAVETLVDMLQRSGSSVSDDTWIALLRGLSKGCHRRDHPLWTQLLDVAPLKVLQSLGEPPSGSEQDALCLPGVSISAALFRTITGFVIHKTLPLVLQSPDKLSHLLANVFYDKTKLKELGGLGQQWSWLMWALAESCVASKLRTPLGKPVDTFLVIENEIKSLALATLKGGSGSGVKLEKAAEDESDGGELLPALRTTPPPSTAAWFRVHCLLLFMESLDKGMYNAAMGTAYALQPAQKTARAFFSNNRKTCSDWIGRVRIALMTVAVHSGAHGTALRLATQALQESDGKLKLGGNLELLLLLAAEAARRAGSWEALIGLHHWVKEKAGKRLPHLKPAALIAQHRYEPAAELLRASLSELGEDGKTGVGPLPSAKAVLSKHLGICHASLGDWGGVRGVLDDLNTDVEAADPGLADFLRRMGDWGPPEATNNNHRTPLEWDLGGRIQDMEAKLAGLLRADAGGKTSANATEKLRSDMADLEEVLLCHRWPHAPNADLDALRRVVGLVGKKPEDSDSLWASVDAGTPLPLAVALGDWRSRLGHGEEGQRFDFDLRLSRGLRKGRNFGASAKLLLKYLPESGTPEQPWATELNSAWRLGIGAQSEPWRWLPLARHAAKLLCPDTPSREGFALLCEALSRSVEAGIGSVLAQAPGESLLSATATRLAHLGNASGFRQLRNELSRGILRLSVWLGEAPELGEILLLSENSLFIKLVEEQLSITENFLGALDSGSIVGALLTLSASLCPELSKAQRSFADWAYNAGRKAVEGWSREERVLLTADELGQARAALPADATPADLDALVTILSSLRSADNPLKTEADVCVAVQSSVIGISAPSAAALGGVWAQANRRLFLFYESAAAAYFAYLRFSGESESAVTMRATLRLLRLLVKHGDDLSLAEGFEASEPEVWRRVVPQLLARGKHASPAVRSVLRGLLARLAIAHPPALAFPLLVAAEEDELLGGLEAAQPELMGQMRLFVRELNRIALLREEKTHYVLSHLGPEFQRRLKRQIEEEAATAKNEFVGETDKAAIISDKARIHSEMVFKVVRDLVDWAEATAETPNEAQFLVQFGGDLKRVRAAIDVVLDPATILNAQTLRAAWVPCENIVGHLSERMCRNLDMRSLCPALSALSGTRIPLPGTPDDGVFLHSIRPAVLILTSKTRPKKLHFVGSDGRSYAYLFKGQEDLHLDERIMQFLRVCNLMLNPTRHAARHYAVTPLGPSSGLIQWVHGPVPVFALYRRWQLRESAKTNSVALKPNEMFCNKVAAALGGPKGQLDLGSRQKWAPEMLEKVLAELMDETPKDLLAKELWCRSGSAELWWRLTESFARSTAVMSMIGYLIGLGDRHLDNLLLDMDSGEGLFQLASEEICGVLRGGRETLLTLLEAFVYDPLVDWAQDAHTETAFQLPHNLALVLYGGSKTLDEEAAIYAKQMLAVRQKEYVVAWLANREALEASLENYIIALPALTPLFSEESRLRELLGELEADLGRRSEGLPPPPSLLPPLSEAELSTAVSSCRTKLSAQTIALNTALAPRWQDIRGLLAAHHRLVGEARPALRTLAKTVPSAAAYLHRHKEWLDRLVGGLNPETRPTGQGNLHNAVSAALKALPEMFTLLDGGWEALVAEGPSAAVEAGEERSAQGMAIWRRVRLKLEGRHGDPNIRLSAKQQVEEVIAEAKNRKKLALMYEGWTAWV